MRIIRLKKEYLKDQKALKAYFAYELGLPGDFRFSIQSLIQFLEKVDEDVQIVVDQKTISAICADKFSFQILLALGKAADTNPNLEIFFREN